jgi:hypothetical protein
MNEVSFNGNMKWILGAVFTIAMTLAGWLLSRAVFAEMDDLSARTTGIEQRERLSAKELGEITARQQYMIRQLERIEQKLDDE